MARITKGQQLNQENQTREENRMKESIRKCFGTGALSLVLLLAAGIPALAKNYGTMILDHDIVLHGKALPAGKYVVEWKSHSPEATVQFLQRYRVVLFAEGRVERRHRIYDHDSVVYNEQPDGSKSLIEIRFAGSNKVLVFDQKI